MIPLKVYKENVPAVRCYSNQSVTTKLYTLSLHDALPIFPDSLGVVTVTTPSIWSSPSSTSISVIASTSSRTTRSEEHTSELQSRGHLVCRLLLEKKLISSTFLRKELIHYNRRINRRANQ